MSQPLPQTQTQTQLPAAANVAVVVAAIVLSRPFVRVLNTARFLIGGFGVVSIVAAFMHFERVRGTPEMAGATFGLFASFFICFACIVVASALGFIPRLARALNLPM